MRPLLALALVAWFGLAQEAPFAPDPIPLPQGPADDVQAAEAPADEAPETLLDSLYLGAALGNELNGRFPVRLVAGLALPDTAFGVRLTLDYGRQSPVNHATLAAAAHLLYQLRGDTLRAYAGAGLGFQVDFAGFGQAGSGLLFGGLVGAEYRIDKVFGVFLEAGVDVYSAAPPDPGGAFVYDRVYPTIAAGGTFRLP